MTIDLHPHEKLALRERGSCDLPICGIPYRVAWCEGQAVFRHVHGFYGHNLRIVITKHAGLLCVRCEDNLGGCVPVAHVTKAAKLAEEILGPDHFDTIEDKRRYRRNAPWFRVTHHGPWCGWRSGLVQIKGRPVLWWGEYRRKRPTTLVERATAQQEHKRAITPA